jgi:Domain of unknown function (DUF4326)
MTANPYRIGRDGTPAQVIARYRQWLLARPDLAAQLAALRGRRLGCWYPDGQPCHARVIAELADAGGTPLTSLPPGPVPRRPRRAATQPRP